jgi:hypothetical protein
LRLCWPDTVSPVPPPRANFMGLYRAMLLAGADHAVPGTYLPAAAPCDSELLARVLEELTVRGDATRLEVIAHNHIRHKGARIARH